MTEQKDKEIELKFCPFCGGEPRYERCPIHPNEFDVWCDNGECEVQPLHSGSSAKAAWNTRSATDIDVVTKLQADVDMLVEALEEILKPVDILPNGRFSNYSQAVRYKAKTALERVKESRRGSDV